MCKNVEPSLKAKHMVEKFGKAKAMTICYQNYHSYNIADAGYWYWVDVADHII